MRWKIGILTLNYCFILLSLRMRALLHRKLTMQQRNRMEWNLSKLVWYDLSRQNYIPCFRKYSIESNEDLEQVTDVNVRVPSRLCWEIKAQVEKKVHAKRYKKVVIKLR